VDSGFEGPEIACEIEVLVGRKMLVREYQHRVLIERLFDASAIFAGQRERQIDIANLRCEGVVNGENNHGRPPLLKAFKL